MIIDGVHYDANKSFTHNELLTIIAKQATHYLNNKAYGTSFPHLEDCPHQMRTASLKFHKKDILQFMPHHSMVWDDNNQCGNTTCSGAVNNIITRVKKYEARQEGILSKTWHVMEWENCICFLPAIFMPLMTSCYIW